MLSHANCFSRNYTPGFYFLLGIIKQILSQRFCLALNHIHCATDAFTHQTRMPALGIQRCVKHRRSVGHCPPRPLVYSKSFPQTWALHFFVSPALTSPWGLWLRLSTCQPNISIWISTGHASQTWHLEGYLRFPPPPLAKILPPLAFPNPWNGNIIYPMLRPQMLGAMPVSCHMQQLISGASRHHLQEHGLNPAASYCFHVPGMVQHTPLSSGLSHGLLGPFPFLSCCPTTYFKISS